MLRSDTIVELAKALSAFQRELPTVTKNAENPYFQSRYADLATIWEAIRIPLTKNGLSVTQTLDTGLGHELIVETTLLHTSGEWLASKWAMPLPVKTTSKKNKEGEIISETETLNDPQAVGSVITYARRYALSAILGIASEDDDAESATDHKDESPEGLKTTPLATAKEHWCEEHKVNFREHKSKDGRKKWWSHSLPNGTWCAEKAKAKVETESPQIAPQSTPEGIDNVADSKPLPEGIPNTKDALLKTIKADLLVLKNKNIWTIDKMITELEKLGFKGSKVTEILDSMPIEKIDEFYALVKKVL